MLNENIKSIRKSKGLSQEELAIKLLSAWVLISRLGYLGVCITEPASWTLMTLFLGGAYLLKYRATLTKEEML